LYFVVHDIESLSDVSVEKNTTESMREGFSSHKETRVHDG